MAKKQKLSYPVLTDPFKHQLEGASAGIKEKALAIFFEPRLGKTFTALLIAALRFQRGEVFRVLVVCKKIFMDVWETEATERLDVPLEFIRLEGRKNAKLKKVNTVRNQHIEKSQLTVVLVNYEMTWRIIRDLRECGFDMIILDESRRISGPYSKQSKACHILGDEVRYKLILTGTPMAEGPLDIWSQYRFLDPSVFGNDYEVFFDRYAKTWDMEIKLPNGSMKTIPKVTGIKHREHLIKLVHSKAIVRTQEECLDLPPMTVQPVWIDLSPASRKFHDQFESGEEVVISGTRVEVPISLQRLAKQSQITGGFAKQGSKIIPVGTEKLDAMEELIEDHPSTWKIVIFTRYHHEMDAILERLKKMKRTAYEVSGRIPDKDNSIRIKNFQQVSRYTTLVVQTDKGALGLDFTASNTEIFYTPSFSYEMYYQATQRVQGPKQKRPIITIFQLRCRNSADDTIYTSLNNKEDVEDYILKRHRRI